MIAVAIDGPAGAGKSTIARLAAQKLGFIYVDTGALYRAVGLCMLRHHVDPADVPGVCGTLNNISLSLAYRHGQQKVILCGEDVTAELRSEEVSKVASRVSAIPGVRKFLFSLQRDIAQSQNVVMDGRDIGTVVLPDAQVKIFLTASAEERARRRYEELRQKGERADYEEVLSDLKQRDDRDIHRSVSPLKQAPDAILADTTGNTLEQSVSQVTAIIEKHLSGQISEQNMVKL